MQHPNPEHPSDAGIPIQVPNQSRIEGAELLANEARPHLLADGFTDQEIEEWALTYISNEGSGDVDSFLWWIADRESA